MGLDIQLGYIPKELHYLLQSLVQKNIQRYSVDLNTHILLTQSHKVCINIVKSPEYHKILPKITGEALLTSCLEFHKIFPEKKNLEAKFGHRTFENSQRISNL